MRELRRAAKYTRGGTCLASARRGWAGLLRRTERRRMRQARTSKLLARLLPACQQPAGRWERTPAALPLPAAMWRFRSRYRAECSQSTAASSLHPDQMPAGASRWLASPGTGRQCFWDFGPWTTLHATQSNVRQWPMRQILQPATQPPARQAWESEERRGEPRRRSAQTTPRTSRRPRSRGAAHPRREWWSRSAPPGSLPPLPGTGGGREVTLRPRC